MSGQKDAGHSDLLSGLEFLHFAVLAAVAEERSLVAASERFDESVGNIGERIAQLERIVGAPLVERREGSSAISLTDAGRVMLGHAERILARVAAAGIDVTRWR